MAALRLPLRLALLALLLPHFSVAQSTEPIQGREFTAAGNFPKTNTNVNGAIFIPDGVERIRAVIVLIDYGWIDYVYYEEPWRRLAKEEQAAILRARLANTMYPTLAPPAQQLLRKAAVGGGPP